jgi:hypothetical protein
VSVRFRCDRRPFRFDRYTINVKTSTKARSLFIINGESESLGEKTRLFIMNR